MVLRCLDSVEASAVYAAIIRAAGAALDEHRAFNRSTPSRSDTAPRTVLSPHATAPKPCPTSSSSPRKVSYRKGRA